jgi:hypothetical protein
MLARTVALSIVLLCFSAIATAQEAKSGAPPAPAVAHHIVSADADQYREALEANAASIAVGNSLTAEQPSRAQLFGILLLISLERREANTGVRR